jgi:hypothetical protein
MIGWSPAASSYDAKTSGLTRPFGYISSQERPRMENLEACQLLRNFPSYTLDF